jgi:putative tricarboxylic transport membrane protein
MKYPDAPLILGLILGPMLDENLRRGLILNEGSLEPFFSRPISIILIVFILMTLFSRNQFLKQTLGRVKILIFSGFRKPK